MLEPYGTHCTFQNIVARELERPCVSNHSLLPHPPTQTTAASKTASSLLEVPDLMPQRQRGGTVDGVRDHTRRVSDGVVDARRTSIPVWLRDGQRGLVGIELRKAHEC